MKENGERERERERRITEERGKEEERKIRRESAFTVLRVIYKVQS